MISVSCESSWGRRRPVRQRPYQWQQHGFGCFWRIAFKEREVLRKIDCVMIRVEDVEAAAAYYAKVFGLRPLWSGEGAVGLVFPETDAEIVLHRETTIPSSVEVHYKVDDVVVAVAYYAAQGCQILVAPFDITIGKCAVIRDPFGTRLCILDTTKGHRASNLAEPQGLM
jgi:lactoylglutathione lyase